MAYKNNFPKMYIFTKCLQIKRKKDRKVQKRVNEDCRSPPVKQRIKMYKNKTKTDNNKTKHTSYS